MSEISYRRRHVRGRNSMKKADQDSWAAVVRGKMLSSLNSVSRNSSIRKQNGVQAITDSPNPVIVFQLLFIPWKLNMSRQELTYNSDFNYGQVVCSARLTLRIVGDGTATTPVSLTKNHSRNERYKC